MQNALGTTIHQARTHLPTLHIEDLKNKMLRLSRSLQYLALLHEK
jgi:hypothetical protein